MEGTIVFISPSRGFGFILPHEPQPQRVFFHYSKAACLEHEITKGARVRYEVEETERGLQAAAVHIIAEVEGQ